MALSYSDFKDYLITFLWKKGDQQLIASLDKLITMGEAKLNRDLDIEKRHTSVLIVVDSQNMQLPDDYYKIRSVVDTDNTLGELLYVTPAELEATRARTTNQQWLPIYSIQGNQIMFVGPAQGGRRTTGPVPPSGPQNGDLWFRTTVAPGLYQWVVDPTSSQWVQLTAEPSATMSSPNTRNIAVHYMNKVPNYAVADMSWVAEDFLDLLVYCTLIQTAPFLREDERLQVWSALYQSALDKTVENSAHEQVRGIANAARLPRQAGVHRRR